MTIRDIDTVAELLARIGGSWHPEKPRPAPNGISNRHRDVARLILAELRRRDAERNEALTASEPMSQNGTPDPADEAEIPVGAVVAYCPPGDTRTVTCTVERIEHGRAYLVPVRREIGWISTNTLQPLPSPNGRPKMVGWSRPGQAGPSRDGGASLWPNAANASGSTEQQPAAPAAEAAAASSDPVRKPVGTVVQARPPQKNPTAPASPTGEQSQTESAPEQVLPVIVPGTKSKQAKGGAKAAKVEYYFDSSGQWVAFRLHRNDPYLFNKKGKWIGWFPWKDDEAVDVHGRYLGTVLDTNRIYRKKPSKPRETSVPSGRKPGFVLPPSIPGYAGYAERVAFCQPPYGYQDIDWTSLPVGQAGRLKSTHLAMAEGGYLHRFLSVLGLSGLASRIERMVRPSDAR